MLPDYSDNLGNLAESKRYCYTVFEHLYYMMVRLGIQESVTVTSKMSTTTMNPVQYSPLIRST